MDLRKLLEQLLEAMLALTDRGAELQKRVEELEEKVKWLEYANAREEGE